MGDDVWRTFALRELAWSDQQAGILAKAYDRLEALRGMDDCDAELSKLVEDAAPVREDYRELALMSADGRSPAWILHYYRQTFGECPLELFFRLRAAVDGLAREHLGAYCDVMSKVRIRCAIGLKKDNGRKEGYSLDFEELMVGIPDRARRVSSADVFFDGLHALLCVDHGYALDRVLGYVREYSPERAQELVRAIED